MKEETEDVTDLCGSKKVGESEIHDAVVPWEEQPIASDMGGRADGE